VFRIVLGLAWVSAIIAPCAPAFGWADVGHEVVCEIALLEMTDAAKNTVQQLMNAHPDFSTFAEACNWPDGPTRERKGEHYINVPRSDSEIRTEACQLDARCLFTAIRKDSDDVSSGLRSDTERAEALAYFGHWIGDIHQPLHVAFQDDKGGNDIQESGSPCTRSLHLVWDLCIIEKRLGSDSESIAELLHGDVTDTERGAWTNSTAVDWADESFKITTSEKLSYCVERDGACWYETQNERFEPGEAKKAVSVDDSYIDLHLPTVRQRLQQAGIRLGSRLNGLLDPPRVP